MKRFTLFLLAAMVLPLTMNAQTKNDVPEGFASVTLTAGNVWDDGTGYQMLLDADATAYGSIIPETGGLTSSGDASAQVYAEFEYKIPENADGSCSTSNIVFDNSITILIPAGIYDWCITNPTPGDRVWIASSNGNVGGRADNYEFLSGVGYEFTVTLGGSNDQVDVTIDDPTAPVIPTGVQVTPTVTTGEVIWVAGENNTSWNLRWRPWVEPVLVGKLWDFPLDGYEEQIDEGWSAYDADGDGNNWGLAYSSDAQDDACFYSASYSNGSALDPDNWLITPEVGLGGTLKFKTWNYSSNWLDRIKVYVCNNPDYASVEEFVPISDFIQPTTTSADEAMQIELDLSAYDGSGHIAFRHYDSYDQFGIYIDDIEVIPVNPAELQEWTVVESLTTPTYTIENLTSNTKYEVQVMAFNEFGVNTNWTETVVFTTLEGYIKHIDSYTANGGYYLIASPIGQVNPSNVGGMLDNEYDLYYFDQIQDLEWINYKQVDGFDLVPGKGYLYANSGNNGEGIDLVFVGSANTEINEVTLALESGVEFEGWNLVGNPFAVEAYIDRNFYTMNPDGSEIIAAEGNSIAPMEGVFVIANVDGETLNFTTTEPTGKSAQLILNVTSNRSNVIDRAIVRFGEGNGMPKFQLNPSHTKIYIPVDNKDYAVVNAIEMGEIPVNFKAENNGTYTFSFTNENVEFGYLHLIDNMTGAEVDLLAHSSYSFEAKTTDYANRFKLVFSTDNASNDYFAYFSNGSLVINNEGDATMNIYDITGRLVNTQTINGSCQVGFNAAPGVYMIQMVNGNDVKTQKIVVK